MTSLISQNYSGIIINQNYNSTATVTVPQTFTQTFNLPENFKRGNYIPSLTGFQVKIESTNSNNISANWTISSNSDSRSGVISKCALDANGVGWLDIKCDPLEVSSTDLNKTFTLSIEFFSGSSVTKIYKSGSILAHRVFASTADEGADFLSNSYRSIVINSNSNYLTTQSQTSNYWMSKPNPSEFGVESLYFNLGTKQVIDSVYLDPVTPNVYFHVYYSNDLSGPGVDEDSWDDLLWTPVRETYQATKKQDYVFPEPISAQYIKIEFSHLQAREYPVGLFQKPIRYKKHPKWVLDYFLVSYNARRNKTFDAVISDNVDVTYDALDLAFNYYKNDIFMSPNGIETVGLANYDQQYVTKVLTSVDDYTGLSGEILNKIKLSFKAFQKDPVMMGDKDTIIGQIASTRAASDGDRYSVESPLSKIADTSTVSVLDREPLILEKNFPVMHFYLSCKHGYREALAKFENSKAYFVGVNEIAFQRDLHQVPYDSGIYIESTKDDQNVEINDFNNTDQGWVV